MPVVFCAAWLIFLSYRHFLTGAWLFHHDSLSAMPSFHIFFESFFRGRVPLWSPYQNMGEPIWLSTEALQAWDPIAAVVYAFAYITEMDSMLAYQWCCVIWILLFALGGMWCSRFIYINRWIQLSVFALLLIGPVGQSTAAGSPAFLLPFRYLPFVFIALIRFYEEPSWRRGFLLGLCLGIAGANYQTLYALPFIALAWVCLKRRTKNFRTALPYEILALLLVALIWAPFFVSGYHMFRQVAVARDYFPHGFSLSTPVLLFGLLDFKHVIDQSHGGSYVGAATLAFALYFIFSPSKWKSHDGMWLAIAALAFFMSSDLMRPALGLRSDEPFLFVRNWGDAISVFALAATQLFVCGVRTFSNAPQWKTLGALTVATGALWYFSGNWGIRYNDSFVSVAQLSFPVVLLWFLSVPSLRRFIPMGVFFLCFLDATIVALKPIPHLENSAEFRRNAPHVKSPVAGKFQMDRETEFPFDSYAPYHFLGPTLHKRWVTEIPPLLPPGKAAKIYGLTHLFRVKNFKEAPTKVLEIESGNVRVDYWDEDTLRATAKTDAPSALVFRDNFTPHWEARVNGIAAKIERAIPVGKRISLPAGTHTIEFRYQPWSYLAAFYLRAAVTLFSLILCLYFWKSTRSIPT